MLNNIKNYRKLYKLRQKDLAEKLEICRQTVIAIERSKHEPSLKLAFKISRIFNCSIEDLFTDK